METQPRTTLILMVEDNPDVSRINRKLLIRRGFDVISAVTLAEARSALAQNKPDLILLDIILPDGSGLAFIGEIREVTTAPIILLTSMSEGEDIYRGLMTGADDYMTKPYRIDELYARIVAQLRRVTLHSREDKRELKRAGLVLDLVAGQAFAGGQNLMLGPKEFALLQMLIRNEGETLSREHLYEEIWKQPAVDTRSVHTHISRLRGKLKASGARMMINSHRGKGYSIHEMDKA